MALFDPDKPAGAIVEVFEDGDAMRNDGVRLMAARKNPWYVLATVAGEQGEIFHNAKLHKKNRRIWNGWTCRDMENSKRAEWAEKLKIDVQELAPLDIEDTDLLNMRFGAAFPNMPIENSVPKIQEPWDCIDFTHLHFENHFSVNEFLFKGKTSFYESYFGDRAYFRNFHATDEVNFAGVHFSGRVYFFSSHFASSVNFRQSHFDGRTFFSNSSFVGGVNFHAVNFRGKTRFEDTRFGADCDFEATHFDWDAFFNGAQFSGDAKFDKKVRFAGNAVFDEAIFKRKSNFSDACFEKTAGFSDGAFKGSTDFYNARFTSHVPTFYQREMHQDTTFTEDPAYWPAPTPDNAQHGKQAYTRLRQIAAGNQNPDLEHFFLRQEMRCKEVLAKDRIDRWAFAAYRIFSDYGISFAWPAFWLAAVWGFGWGIIGSYLRYSTKCCESVRVIFNGVVGAAENTKISENPIGDGAIISLGNTLPFIDISKKMHEDFFKAAPWWLDLLSALQSILGIILIFFIALGLRNRFRLK